MQRKRGELVPIGDVLSDLGGPVKAIREASPQALHHFTRGVAPAGDTVEIVRVVDGRGHGHVAGVRIRASARFCAAHADNVPTRLSAARLFDGSG